MDLPLTLIISQQPTPLGAEDLGQQVDSSSQHVRSLEHIMWSSPQSSIMAGPGKRKQLLKSKLNRGRVSYLNCRAVLQ